MSNSYLTNHYAEIDPLSPSKILIIDDSPWDRNIYRRFLESDPDHDYMVIEADNLRSGLELWKNKLPDLVLLDYILLDGDGLQFLENIRPKSLVKLPIIMLTAEGNEKVAGQAMRLGAMDYLVKQDINKFVLIKAVSQILAKVALQKKLLKYQQKDQIISDIALRIRQYLNIEEVLNASVREVKDFLEADRVIVYKFQPDFNGKIVAEALSPPWTTSLNQEIIDTCFTKNKGGIYRDGDVYSLNDIYQGNLTPCHLQLLERFEVKANLVVPILLKNQSRQSLWGLLIAHQCSGPRQWQNLDIKLLQRLSVQIAIALQQAELYQSLEQKVTQRTLELEKLNQQLELKVKERTQELLRINGFQEAILNSTDYMIITTDLNGVIQTFNRGSEQELGYDASEVIGKYKFVDFLAPMEKENTLAMVSLQFKRKITSNLEILDILKILVNANGAYSIKGEGKLIRKDGSSCFALLSLNIIKNAQQETVGFLGIAQNITERKATEKALQDSQTRWQFALEGAGDGIWDVNLQTQEFFYSHNWKGMLGYTDKDITNDFRMWEKLIHPEDRQRCLDYVENYLQGNIANYELEHRLLCKDGSYKWILSRGKLIECTEDGQPLRLIGTHTDISDRKQAELEREQLTQKLDIALKSGAIGCWDWDLKTNQVTLDERMFELYKLTPTTNYQINYQDWKAYLNPDDLVTIETLVAKSIKERIPLAHDFFIYYSDGSKRYIQAYAIVVRNEQDEPKRMVGVNIDISDRKESEILLQKTNQELLRITRLKDEFLANMSHELRTPLNAILGLTEALGDEILGEINQKQRQTLETIDRSANHLLSLINDILDLAKIESGEIKLELEPVSVIVLCQSSLTFVKQLAYKKQIHLQTKITDHLPPLYADERRIRQVLINLLNNAVKFTPEGGKITLEVSQLPDIDNCQYIRLAVIDTGIGISSDNLQKLFQPFIQIDSSLNRQYEGTGLGLALVKNIVELHGGKVSVISKEGEGSTFMIDLPCASLETTSSSENITTRNSDYIIDEENEEIMVNTKPLILLVEDNEANIITVSNYLITQDYRLIYAKNGQEAITMTKSKNPDLIIMDVQMPIMDGLEATKYIRKELKLTEIPIIALTALAMKGDQEKCLEAGATEYLSKPVKMKNLIDIMRKLLIKFPTTKT